MHSFCSPARFRRWLMWRVVSACCFIVLAAGALLAQSTYGTILGTVRDSTGALIPGARVTLQNSGTAAERATVTDASGNYAFSNIDYPWRWSQSVSYQLPFGKGKHWLDGGGVMNYVVGGWSLNAVSIFQTGFPLQISQATNYNSSFGYASQRPNATGTSPITSGSLEARLNNYINPAAFSTAPEYTFGNVGRTIDMRGPGQVNWDMSIFKDVLIKEKVKAQFRCEALNAMNTPLFYGPSTTFGSSSFGKITTQANFSRQMQLALRFSF